MLRLIAYGGLGAALIAMVIAIGAWGVLRVIPPEPPEPYAGMTGMEILQAHACHRAETKEIIVRGVEDDFSPAGEEPAVVREAIRTPMLLTRTLADYDHPGLDYGLIDHFEAPAHTVGGLLVIAMRGNGGGWENDAVVIGDLHYMATGTPFEGRHAVAVPIAEAEDRQGWTWTGRFMVLELDEAKFGLWNQNAQGEWVLVRDDYVPETLTDYVRGHDEAAPIDVFVADDMSVDFIGAALCLEPRPRRGLTLNLASRRSGDPHGAVVYTPAADSPGETQGNPYAGDTPCTLARPLLCFRDRQAAAPQSNSSAATWADRIWSGGEVALTDPVRGDALATLADARTLCEAEFGEDWRVATFHDGNDPGRFQAFGEMRDPAPPAWVDIRGQPHATCWGPAP